MLRGTADPILALGVFVAEEIFGLSFPIVAVPAEEFDGVLAHATHATVTPQSEVVLGSSQEEVNTAVQGLMSAVSSHAGSKRSMTAEDVVRASGLKLTDQERAVLENESGDENDAKSLAMRILVRAAAADSASRLIPIKQAHIDAVTFIGQGGLRFAQELADRGGRVCVPTTLNSGSIDRRSWQALGVPESLGEPAQALGDAFLSMGCSDSFTCAPYLLDTAPVHGDQIAWGESNAVVFSNSVLGARTQKIADYLDICCAITGRAPFSGVHLEEMRIPRVIIEVGTLIREIEEDEGTATRADMDALFPLLGYLCGRKSEAEIPAIVGLEKSAISQDDLKAFSAAFGSTAAAPMYHIAGHTPEAPAVGWDLPDLPRVELTLEDLCEVWGMLNGDEPSEEGDEDGHVQLIAVGNPHLSLSECSALSDLCCDDGRTGIEGSGVGVADGVSMVATIGRQVYAKAEAEGEVQKLSAFGVRWIRDTCWCMLNEPVVPVNADTVMTNSAKYAHYGPGLVGRRMRFGSLGMCVEAARTGRVPAPPKWIVRGMQRLLARR